MPTDDDRLFEHIALESKLVSKTQMERAMTELAEREDAGEEVTIGDVLREQKVITDAQFTSIINAQVYRKRRVDDKSLGRKLNRSNLASKDEIEDSLEVQKSEYARSGHVRPLGEILVERDVISQTRLDEFLKKVELRRALKKRAAGVPDGVVPATSGRHKLLRANETQLLMPPIRPGEALPPGLKACPLCERPIKNEARRCRWCKKDLPGTKPKKDTAVELKGATLPDGPTPSGATKGVVASVLTGPVDKGFMPFVCSECDTKLTVRSSRLGETVTCPSCNARVRAGEGDEDDDADEPVSAAKLLEGGELLDDEDLDEDDSDDEDAEVPVDDEEEIDEIADSVESIADDEVVDDDEDDDDDDEEEVEEIEEEVVDEDEDDEEDDEDEDDEDEDDEDDDEIARADSADREDEEKQGSASSEPLHADSAEAPAWAATAFEDHVPEIARSSDISEQADADAPTAAPSAAGDESGMEVLESIADDAPLDDDDDDEDDEEVEEIEEEVVEEEVDDDEDEEGDDDEEEVEEIEEEVVDEDEDDEDESDISEIDEKEENADEDPDDRPASGIAAAATGVAAGAAAATPGAIPPPPADRTSLAERLAEQIDPLSDVELESDAPAAESSASEEAPAAAAESSGSDDAPEATAPEPATAVTAAPTAPDPSEPPATAHADGPDDAPRTAEPEPAEADAGSSSSDAEEPDEDEDEDEDSDDDERDEALVPAGPPSDASDAVGDRTSSIPAETMRALAAAAAATEAPASDGDHVRPASRTFGLGATLVAKLAAARGGGPAIPPGSVINIRVGEERLRLAFQRAFEAGFRAFLAELGDSISIESPKPGTKASPASSDGTDPHRTA